MIHFDLPKQQSSIIKVLGVGGGGSNAVNFMYEQKIEGVDFIICNTDAKALEQSNVPNKIQLGPHLTQGLGAGADPEKGRNATQESLDEIKRILEVNTKMVFVCAGMGGGTGTGGAPIIAKLCKELGILTVGIVTTPFPFEGPRRTKLAEEGVRELESYVDTLLVISNDKMRVQYGNLKMKEAFGKADNVLATAAKCITDIIGSKGHVVVDFADVCTVMKNGGVAILGSAAAEGEDRAQRVIEEALTSPLLNDSDIKGAKWILININSADGEHAFTMDELDVISTHLRMQTGDNTDVIMGMGNDDSLGSKIGVTLIATGFTYKDPFPKDKETKKSVQGSEKIIHKLRTDDNKNEPDTETPQNIIETTQSAITQEQTILKQPAAVVIEGVIYHQLSVDTPTGSKQPEPAAEKTPFQQAKVVIPTFLSKPANVYTQPPAAIEAELLPVLKPKLQPIFQPQPALIEPQQPIIAPPAQQEIKCPPMAEPSQEEEDAPMQLVIKEQVPNPVNERFISVFDINEVEEEQKRKVAKSIHKIFDMSLNNLNAADPDNEFERIPAYVRRNISLFNNTLSSVENYYSKYTVDASDDADLKIGGTLNAFLSGENPD